MDRAVAIVPLADVWRPDDKEVSEYVRSVLREFQCERDHVVNRDVVNFIAYKAIDFEANHVCRTFLAVDSDALSFGELKVYGYFALQAMGTKPDADAVAALDDAEREMLESSSGVINGMLLVQLARDSRYKHSDLDGEVLLRHAETQARQATDQMGGELLYLDCSDEMVAYYTDQGYEELEFEEGLHRMVKSLYSNPSPLAKRLALS